MTERSTLFRNPTRTAAILALAALMLAATGSEAAAEELTVNALMRDTLPWAGAGFSILILLLGATAILMREGIFFTVGMAVTGLLITFNAPIIAAWMASLEGETAPPATEAAHSIDLSWLNEPIMIGLGFLASLAVGWFLFRFLALEAIQIDFGARREFTVKRQYQIVTRSIATWLLGKTG